MTTLEIMKRAKESRAALAGADTEAKNRALCFMADKIIEKTDDILAANGEDMEAARGKINEVMLDRLMLDSDRIRAMADGIRHVAALPDPAGRILKENLLDNGLKVEKVSVPLGVVAIIYESRPNVTSDAASLAVKSGNACILRCGKEAHRSAAAIVAAMREGLSFAGFPADCVSLVEDTSRASATELMKGVGYIDLLIPRGGAGLIKSCLENAEVPCIETGTGICHVYVDCDADLEKAVRIVNNAKTSRPSVCNAMEVLVVHEAVVGKLMPMLDKVLVEDRLSSGLEPVEIRADAAAAAFSKYARPSSESDYDTEFLNYILAVKTVGGVGEAVEHISLHSTKHSDAIVTENGKSADFFVKNIDSAAVYVNASTRFTDGGVFGLGCEMGISTQKLHARGPMGLEELTSYKYVVRGDGHVR